MTLRPDLAVWRPDRGELEAPAYRGDVLELRLGPRAARAARPSARPSSSTEHLEHFGIADLDHAAAEIGGMWFEPEFRGERPPAAGSSETDFTAFWIAHLSDQATLETALDRFIVLSEVLSVSPIAVLPVSAMPNDSLWSHSWWYYQPPERHDIHAPEAWDLTTGDTTIVVAVLDTGVLTDHPELGGTVAGNAGQFWTNPAEAKGVPGADDDGNLFVDDVHGWDFVSAAGGALPPCEDGVDQDNDPDDYAGHGTAVAGLIGALSNNLSGVTGTAWNVRIMPLRIGWSTVRSPLGLVDMSYVAQAIRYAARMGASVANCSFETLNTDGLYEAASDAVRAGVTIVAAAGNASPFHDLADLDDVVAVGATDANDRVAPFSNLGDFVDLCAPGVGIISTFVDHVGTDCDSIRQPSYSPRLDGTSLSAPLVSGAVALLQARRLEQGRDPVPPLGVVLRARETADDISAENPSLTGYGSGRLDVARLLGDPEGSTAVRAGAATVGSAVVLPREGGGSVVAYVTTNQKLLLMEGRDDTLAVASLPGQPIGHLAAADLGGGRGVGLFASTSAGNVAGFDGSGRALAGWPAAASEKAALSTGPSLGDLDGDGVLEVIAATEDGSIWAWRSDGSLVTPGFPTPPFGSTTAEGLALADLDSLPGVEIVATLFAGRLLAIHGDGTTVPGWSRGIGPVPTSPVVARMDPGETPTVIVGTQNRAGTGSQLLAFRSDGSLRFNVALPTVVQDLAAGDLDGDGLDEIVAITSSFAVAVDSAGRPLISRGWPANLPTFAFGPPLIAELRGGGDGGPEIVFMGASGLVALSDSGVVLPILPRPGGAGRQPTVADLDGAGSAQVLAGTGDDSLLFVYDLGPTSGRPSPWPTPHGNFARTGNRLYAPPVRAPDTVPPAAVADLAADSVAVHGASLIWTAPGDDGNAGRAAAYDLRLSVNPIDESNFGSGLAVMGVPLPDTGGTPQRVRVAGLAESGTYFFALRSRDEAGNVSGISNVVRLTTLGVAPGRVSDLTVAAATESTLSLSWTASGDDAFTGRCEGYSVRAASTPIDDVVFDRAPLSRDVASSVDAGGTETLVFGGLERGHRYWLALKVRDGAGNLSALSNVVAAETDVGGPLRGRGIALAVGSRPARPPLDFYWHGAPGATGAQTIRIYDLAGRLRRILPVGDEAGGVVTWNGRDERSSLVPAGIYFARLTSGSLHVQTRVVLLP